MLVWAENNQEKAEQDNTSQKENPKRIHNIFPICVGFALPKTLS